MNGGKQLDAQTHPEAVLRPHVTLQRHVAFLPDSQVVVLAGQNVRLGGVPAREVVSAHLADRAKSRRDLLVERVDACTNPCHAM